MGGREASRGFLYQAFASVLEAMCQKNWDRIYIEFKSDECAIIGPSHRAPVQGEYDDLVQTPIRKGGGYKRRWEHP